MPENEAASHPAHLPAFPAEIVVVDRVRGDIAQQARHNGDTENESQCNCFHSETPVAE